MTTTAIESQRQAAFTHMCAVMSACGNWGAQDSEGHAAVRQVEYAAGDGEPFPLKGPNPFELYESVPGWRAASAKLMSAAKRYYAALIKERLGVNL